MTRSSALGCVTFAAFASFAAAACSGGGGAPATTATSVTVPAPPVASAAPPPSGSGIKFLPESHSSFPVTIGNRDCRLPSPSKGPDACSADADCGPSEPCHAHACVAAAKAKPRGPNTMCTEIMDCTSTDANDCKCFEGRCALVPRN